MFSAFFCVVQAAFSWLRNVHFRHLPTRMAIFVFCRYVFAPFGVIASQPAYKINGFLFFVGRSKTSAHKNRTINIFMGIF